MKFKSLLGCSAVQSMMLQKYVLPPSSETTWRYIPEASKLHAEMFSL
jgi:hypothetical protein